jgi:glycosyltransferase involved in cell wall biosynthesis
MVNESAVLNTGYSVYGNAILSRLHSSGKYEIAELACCIDKNDPRLKAVPWKIYINTPSEEKEKREFNKNPENSFGSWSFNDVCLDFKPHIVFDIRDFWMVSHENESPLREYFHLCLMPTVDAMPQNEKWIGMFHEVDSILTYSDWAAELLHNQSNGKIKIVNSAPPVANEKLYPLSLEKRRSLKEKLGLKGCKIIGTVMRNQKRKLFPSLFKAFSQFLEKTKDTNTYLYCHTSYPDLGWNIPKLLLQYGLSSRVLFTYRCKKCSYVYPSLFQQANTICDKCNEYASSLISVHNGVDYDNFRSIYNLFDWYIQPANSEGFGMPQLEAAACGVPIMSTDYSAMSDIVTKLGGIPITVKDYILESETGCYRASIDTDFVADQFEKLIKITDDKIYKIGQFTYNNLKKHYDSWDKTAGIWMDHFDSIDIHKYEQLWKSEINIKLIKNNRDDIIHNIDYVDWLMTDVLCNKDKIGGILHSEILNNLNTGYVNNGLAKSIYNRNIAYRHAYNIAMSYNEWERKRGEYL